MKTVNVSAAFPARRFLMPSDRFLDVKDYIKSAAPNSQAAAFIDERYKGRLMPCTDATWCAQEIVSGYNKSEEVGNAMAAYARKFSQEAYLSYESLTSLTAIATLGSNAVRRAVLDNDQGAEVAQCLRSAASFGLAARRQAAAVVLSRYALQAAGERCDGGLLLIAMSALTDVISCLRDHRMKLRHNYDPLMVGTLRSLSSVSRYVGENTISVETMNLLRKVVRMDEVGVIRDGAMKAAAVVSAEPQKLNCGPVKAFGPFTDHPLIENLMG